jgi:hypothetical protein
MDLNELKAKALKDQEVQNAYDELESEFASIDALLLDNQIKLMKKDNSLHNGSSD